MGCLKLSHLDLFLRRALRAGFRDDESRPVRLRALHLRSTQAEITTTRACKHVEVAVACGRMDGGVYCG